MSLAKSLDLARKGELYPAVILHGATDEARQQAALDLARTLLCEEAAADRPCGQCRHCRRICWPGAEAEERFHPDFVVLVRDLKATTSVGATRAMLRTAQVSPFEARGQVFLIASAESLSGEAANSLLKSLEEPHDSAPRHFLLLTPSRLDLLPTLRSRSLAIYLGPSESLDSSDAEHLGEMFLARVADFESTGAALYLLAAADVLKGAGGKGGKEWSDLRAGRPWAVAAAAVVAAARQTEAAAGPLRRRLLALAEELLNAPRMWLRAISHERILEGLVSRHLAG